jgi:hypothetical protein
MPTYSSRFRRRRDGREGVIWAAPRLVSFAPG